MKTKDADGTTHSLYLKPSPTLPPSSTPGPGFYHRQSTTSASSSTRTGTARARISKPSRTRSSPNSLPCSDARQRRSAGAKRRGAQSRSASNDDWQEAAPPRRHHQQEVGAVGWRRGVVRGARERPAEEALREAAAMRVRMCLGWGIAVWRVRVQGLGRRLAEGLERDGRRVVLGVQVQAQALAEV